jgi:glycosidase
MQNNPGNRIADARVGVPFAVGLSLCFLTTCAAVYAGPGGTLHVPSPDWRDQVIYFLVTDRFADGDPRNNDQGAGEYDPKRASHYNGGDLRGVRQRLDYIQGLGATAVWITPPVANQWLEGSGGHTGYHGYWAEHFKQVDRHLGTLEDLRALSRGLHGRGMYLVQDIVLNHTGNFFRYQGGWDTRDPARFYEPVPGLRPSARPRQVPFNLNDPRRAPDRAAGIYHWTPDVADFNDAQQEARFQMSGLDDLATENPRVRRALRDAYGFWIREAGVDAFRVDTLFYVPPQDVADILHSKDQRAPGLLEAARRTGRNNFLIFGEGFGIDRPGEDTQARKIERYMTDARGRPVVPGMLNFPLYGSLQDVFARGQPTADLAWRIERAMAIHARPHLMPTFVDNHDVDRFLAGGSEAALRQSLLAIFTLPGIPVIYYGTEQGFTEPRAAMFAAGQGSGGRDRFDTRAPLYRAIAALSQLRRSQRALTRGEPQVLARSESGPGVLAWRMRLAGQPDTWVVMNSADHEVLLDKLPTGLPTGARLRGLFSVSGEPEDVLVGAGGLVTRPMPARSGWVWQAQATDGQMGEPRAKSSVAAPALQLDDVPDRVSDNFEATGRAAPGAAVQLVIDGNLNTALNVLANAEGRWSARVDTSTLVDPKLRHTLVVWEPQSAAISETASFVVQRRWQLVADVEDPAGDDQGPQGLYRYPTEASYARARTMDLRRVRVSTSGGAMRLDLDMAGLSRTWNPPNDFDHLALTIFVELPGQAEPGSALMPQQNGPLPAGMRWHRRLRVHGWSNALFAAEGASANSEGTPTTPAARLRVERDSPTIRLMLPAAALGQLSSLSGARIYVTTWDYDGGYRALAAQPQAHTVGGGDPATGLRVMDDSIVIRVP